MSSPFRTPLEMADPTPALRLEQRDQVLRYTQLLLKWNRRINLTRITGEAEIQRQHFGEAFFAAQLLPPSTQTLLDVGSGAGFPGIALKIFRPELRITLLEASTKKCAFLQEVLGILGFRGSATVVHGRLDDFNRDRAIFDAVTVRGVRLTPRTLDRIFAFLGPASRLLVLTSADQAERIQQGTAGMADWETVPVPGGAKRVALVGQKCST
jgi:16S rRNA (guanine527-N7)-methyltransferase